MPHSAVWFITLPIWGELLRWDIMDISLHLYNRFYRQETNISSLPDQDRTHPVMRRFSPSVHSGVTESDKFSPLGFLYRIIPWIVLDGLKKGCALCVVFIVLLGSNIAITGSKSGTHFQLGKSLFIKTGIFLIRFIGLNSLRASNTINIIFQLCRLPTPHSVISA